MREAKTTQSAKTSGPARRRARPLVAKSRAARAIDPYSVEGLSRLKADNLRGLIGRASQILIAKSQAEAQAEGFMRVMEEIEPGRRVPAVVAAIMRLAAFEGGLTMDELLSRGRTQRLARPRQRAMASVRALRRGDGPRYCWTEIGRFFRRDHTTVIHAYETIPAEERIIP